MPEEKLSPVAPRPGDVQTRTNVPTEKRMADFAKCGLTIKEMANRISLICKISSAAAEKALRRLVRDLSQPEVS